MIKEGNALTARGALHLSNSSDGVERALDCWPRLAVEAAGLATMVLDGSASFSSPKNGLRALELAAQVFEIGGT